MEQDTLSYQEWLDRLGTLKLSNIAFNMFIREQSGGQGFDVNQAWFDKYLAYCERKGLEPESTIEDVPGYNATLEEQPEDDD